MRTIDRMQLGVLSFIPAVHSVRRLVEAASSRGHRPVVLHGSEFALTLSREGARMLYRGRPLERVEALIPRVSSAAPVFGVSIVRQYEDTGIVTLNSSAALSISRDKFLTLQVLRAKGLPIPDTVLTHSRKEFVTALEILGGAPVVVKLLHGSQGVGVMLAETAKSAESIMETLFISHQPHIVQRFYRETEGTDVRAFVTAGRVVAAMRRRAAPGEFRSNYHRGGTVERITLEKDTERIALQAAMALGLRVAGVDLLETNYGPLIIEVNGSPGFEGIERASKVDVAGAIIECVENIVEESGHRA